MSAICTPPHLHTPHPKHSTTNLMCGGLGSYLCDLPQIVGVRHPLVAVDAVALHGVGGLGGRVARGHVGGCGGCHGPRVVH
jgi:hypothetical protein